MKNRESNSYISLATAALAGTALGLFAGAAGVYKTQEIAKAQMGLVQEVSKEEMRAKKLDLEACQEIVQSQSEDLRKRIDQAILQPCDKAQVAALEEAASLARETEKSAIERLLELEPSLMELPNEEALHQVFDTVDEHYAYCPKESKHILVSSAGSTQFSDIHWETTVAVTIPPETPEGMATVLYYPEAFPSPCELAASRAHESAHARGFTHSELGQNYDWIYHLDQSVQAMCEKTTPSPETP